MGERRGHPVAGAFVFLASLVATAALTYNSLATYSGYPDFFGGEVPPRHAAGLRGMVLAGVVFLLGLVLALAAAGGFQQKSKGVAWSVLFWGCAAGGCATVWLLTVPDWSIPAYSGGRWSLAAAGPLLMVVGSAWLAWRLGTGYWGRRPPAPPLFDEPPPPLA